MNAIELKAKEIHQERGGTIFAFPIHEEDPFSEYAVVVYAGGMYHTYPQASNINEAALGVKTILDEMVKAGYAADYQRDVRFVLHEAQLNAPSVTMRRLKRHVEQPVVLEENDFHKRDDEEGHLISARGLLKWTYIEMVDQKNPKAIQFMNEYFNLLAMRKYGKTAAAIRQEVKRMSKDQAIKWIERTYSRFVRDDWEVMGILQKVAAHS